MIRSFSRTSFSTTSFNTDSWSIEGADIDPEEDDGGGGGAAATVATRKLWNAAVPNQTLAIATLFAGSSNLMAKPGPVLGTISE